MDVGSNLGGFLFFMEQFGERTDLVGVEGDSRFVTECSTVSRLLGSQVKFYNADIMALTPPEKPYDAIILQNVYQYLYDKIGDHEKIFSHLGRHGRSIIWYNPMSSEDPVIQEHANSNPNTDWAPYNSKDIFFAAMKAGFLHPIPTKQRFVGMGPAREHWLFIQDEVRPLNPQTVELDTIFGTEQPVRDHYHGIHRVFLDEHRSYKLFNDNRLRQMERIQRAVSCGFLDRRLCDGLKYIVDKQDKIVGYSQPRGTEMTSMRKILGDDVIRKHTNQHLWRLFSRMIRFDLFNHDVGTHNYVYLPSKFTPILIDLENIVEEASRSNQLSIYRQPPDANEVQSAEANLNLLFRDIPIVIGSQNPIAVLQHALLRSNFLSRLDVDDVLSRRDL